MPAPVIVTVPPADDFAPLPAAQAALWSKFGEWETEYFPTMVGLRPEEIRTGYCRMRLPYRDELRQPAGVVHGGAIATLIDTVVVPAIGAAYEQVPVMLTLSMTINYVGALVEDDAVAEGWVTRRGKSIVFCEAVVRGDRSGSVVAAGSLVYQIRPA
jgi:uncharacterized protein (TIGR00369 family)